MIFTIFWNSLSCRARHQDARTSARSRSHTSRLTTSLRSSIQLSMKRSLSSTIGYVGCLPAGIKASSLLSGTTR